MRLYIEHPDQNRIRQFDNEPEQEVIIEINARIVHGNIDMTRRELQEMAATALLEALNNLS